MGEKIGGNLQRIWGRENGDHNILYLKKSIFNKRKKKETKILVMWVNIYGNLVHTSSHSSVLFSEAKIFLPHLPIMI